MKPYQLTALMIETALKSIYCLRRKKLELPDDLSLQLDQIMQMFEILVHFTSCRNQLKRRVGSACKRAGGLPLDLSALSTLPEDFNAPLPEEILAAFEGSQE